MEVRRLPAVPDDGPHVATYTINKRDGGYNVRVNGPKAGLFTGQDVPVSTKDGKELMEKFKTTRRNCHCKLLISRQNSKPIGVF
jgi:hypothetical protein